MPVFSANPDRLVPYRNFAFRLKWNGVHVAGVSKMSALKRTSEAIGLGAGRGNQWGLRWSHVQAAPEPAQRAR